MAIEQRPARIFRERSENADRHASSSDTRRLCRWCRRSHEIWEPHAGLAPGDRYDPTRFFREHEEPPERVARWFKVPVADLVAPEQDCYASRRVEVLAWMAREAGRDEFRARRGTPTVFDLITGQPSCVGGQGPLTLASGATERSGGREWDWKTRVADYLRYAILCTHTTDMSRRWRAALGLEYGKTITVPGPTAGPYVLSNYLDALLSFRGQLAWQLNTSHSQAIEIRDIRLTMDDSVSLWLHYGFGPDETGYRESASWSVLLGTRAPGEPIVAMLRRAAKELGRLVDPAAEPPLVDTWATHGGRPAEPAAWVAESRRSGAHQKERRESQ